MSPYTDPAVALRGGQPVSGIRRIDMDTPSFKRRVLRAGELADLFAGRIDVEWLDEAPGYFSRGELPAAFRSLWKNSAVFMNFGRS